MFFWKSRKSLFAQIMVLLMIFSLLSPVKSFAEPDVISPKLNDLTISANEATVGETIKVTADIIEEGIGLREAYVLYKAPARSASKAVHLYYNNETSKYEGTFEVGKYDGQGTWVLDTVRLEDKQGNYYSYENFNKDWQYPYQGENFEFIDLNQYNIIAGESDQVAPKTSVSPVKESWYNSDVELKLESKDFQSGVAKTEYRINDGEWLTYNNGILITNEGVNNVQYRSIDNAGNIEEAKLVEIKIDKTNPNLDISFDQPIITSNNHKLIPVKTFVQADDSLSGIVSFELVSVVSSQLDNTSGDGNSDQDIKGFESGTVDTAFQVRAETSKNEDRVYTVTYKANDNAGNSVLVSKNIIVKHSNSKK